MSQDLLAQISKDLQGNWLSTTTLAEKHGVSSRQIRRYLRKIPGLSIYAEGRRKTYHIQNSHKFPVGQKGYGATSETFSGHSEITNNGAFLKTTEDEVISKGNSRQNIGHYRGHKFTTITHPKKNLNATTLKKKKTVSNGDHPNVTPSDFFNFEEIINALETLVKVEIDTLRFGIVHQGLRNKLLAVSQDLGWKINRTKRDIWLHCEQAPHPVTIQLGNDNAFFYCADPGIDLTWLADYIQTVCSDLEGIEGIKQQILIPNTRYCELTLIVFDRKIVAIIDRILSHHYDKNHELLFQPPNRVIPGLKVYHKKEFLRMEFLANESQKRSLGVLMQELWEAICTPDEIKTKLPSFIESYYPHEKNLNTAILMVLRKGINKIMRNGIAIGVDPKQDEFYAKKEKFFDEYDTLINSIPYSADRHFRPTVNIFMNAFGCSQLDAAVFLAYLSIRIPAKRTSVQYLEIIDFIKEKLDITLLRRDIKKNRQNLIKMGLFIHNPPDEFNLSISGRDIFSQMKLYYRRLNKTR